MAEERIGETAAKLLEDLLYFQNQVRLYHWNTKLYPRHVASGELYEKIDSFIDKFIEIYMGKFNGGSLKGAPLIYKEMEIKLSNVNDAEIIKVLNDLKSVLVDVCKWLSDSMPSYSNTDLKNLIDEIMGDTNRTLYLFTLN